MDDTDDDGSNLSSQELQERARECRAQNTRKTTKWAVGIFENWASRRAGTRTYIKENILEYESAEDLNRALFKFYAEVHTLDGNQFSPSSLQVLRAGLQRHLDENVSNAFDITNGPAFKRANDQFIAAKRKYSDPGLGNPQVGKRKVPIDPADQELIRSYFSEQDTLQIPTKLQQYIYYALSMTFGYRGREIWRKLNKDNFREETDASGRSCIVIDQALIEKNYQSSGGPNTTSRRLMYVTDDEEDGVFLYTTLKFYLSKLHPEEPSFMAKPRSADHVATDPDEPWFEKRPLGIHSIDRMMPTISAAAGTAVRYTNHCCRHTLGTNMLWQGMPLHVIKNRLRLRSVRPLEWYTSHRTAQELQEESRMINAPLRRAAADAAPAPTNGSQPLNRPGPSAPRGTGRSAEQGTTASCTPRGEENQDRIQEFMQRNNPMLFSQCTFNGPVSFRLN